VAEGCYQGGNTKAKDAEHGQAVALGGGKKKKKSCQEKPQDDCGEVE